MRTFSTVLVAVLILGVAFSSRGMTTTPQGQKKAKQAAPKKKKQNAAVERTRDTVRMLDDIYKSSIVLITKHYVHDDEDLPAGTAFKTLFEMVKKKGWHEVRLLDATGEPINDENTPNDAFEKAAIEKLKSGETWYEEVVRKDGQRFLRAATPIPVVMDKCVMCHDNYKGNKGVIGALGYTVPVK